MGDKSVSEILIRLLNVTDNMFDDANNGSDDNNAASCLTPEFDGIRQSYIYKIVLHKLTPSASLEDHLNAQTVLSDLVEYKAVY